MGKQKMLFSIIVPVYKVEKYLKCCVESILTQSYTDFELILVDDGSPDTCPQMCDEYAEKDNRVKVIHKQNGGHSSARRAGLNIAQGEYIIFIDSDDYVAKDYLETFALPIQENGAEVVCLGHVVTDEVNQLNKPICYKEGFYDRERMQKEIFPSLIEDENGKTFSSSLWAKTFKKELIAPVLEQIDSRIIIGEDLVCSKSCMYMTKSMYVADKNLYFYRANPQSITKSKKVRSWIELELRIKTLEKNLSEDINVFEQQLYRDTVRVLFNVVCSQFNRKEKTKIIVKDIKENLQNGYYEQAIKNCKSKDKKLQFARFALKHKLFWLIKIYNKIK